jgi:hypothetical protein
LLRRLLAQALPERLGVAGQFPRWYGDGVALEGVGCGPQQAHLLVGPPEGGIYDRRGDLDGEETVPTRFVDEEEHAADRQGPGAVAVQGRVGEELADVVVDERTVCPCALVVPDLDVADRSSGRGFLDVPAEVNHGVPDPGALVGEGSLLLDDQVQDAVSRIRDVPEKEAVSAGNMWVPESRSWVLSWEFARAVTWSR